MKANRKGANADIFAYLNHAHAILRLYGICLKINPLHVKDFFRPMYITLRTCQFHIDFPIDYRLFQGNNFGKQLDQIDGILRHAARTFNLRKEYGPVLRFIKKIRARLVTGKQTSLDAYL